MGHYIPLLSMAYPICPLNKKISTIPIPIGVKHVWHQPKCLLPRRKVIYPMGWDNMLGSIAPKELVKSKLTVPTTKTTPKDFSSNEYPPSVEEQFGWQIVLENWPTDSVVLLVVTSVLLRTWHHTCRCLRSSSSSTFQTSWADGLGHC